MLLLCSALTSSAQVYEIPTSKSRAVSGKGDEGGFSQQSSFAADRPFSGVYQLPSIQKSRADLSENTPLYLFQDTLTLAALQGSVRSVDSVLDLSVLKEPSAYKNANTTNLKVSDSQARGISAGLRQISAAYKRPGKTSETASCSTVAMSVGHRIRIDPSLVLEIVESEVSSRADCACEIVKVAIKASGADESLVGAIAEVAIMAAPESIRIISQCAIAANPDALTAVQAVLAKLDPNRGDTSYSAKDAKSGGDRRNSADGRSDSDAADGRDGDNGGDYSSGRDLFDERDGIAGSELTSGRNGSDSIDVTDAVASAVSPPSNPLNLTLPPAFTAPPSFPSQFVPPESITNPNPAP